MLTMIIWVACCIGVGYWAQQRGRSSFIWALIAMVVSPVIAAIALAIMKNLAQEGTMAETKSDTQQLRDRLAADEVEIDKRLTEVENEVKELKGEKAAELQGKIDEIKELRDMGEFKHFDPAEIAADNSVTDAEIREEKPDVGEFARQVEDNSAPSETPAAPEPAPAAREIPPEIQEVKDNLKEKLRDAEHDADYATSELRSEVKEVLAEIDDKDKQ